MTKMNDFLRQEITRCGGYFEKRVALVLEEIGVENTVELDNLTLSDLRRKVADVVAIQAILSFKKRRKMDVPPTIESRADEGSTYARKMRYGVSY